MNTLLYRTERVSEPKHPARGGSLRLTNPTLRKILLGCGIVSSILYIASDITCARAYPGYSLIDHTFSELLAIGSPVRSLMIAMNSIPYALLVAAFAYGIWEEGGSKRGMRVAAILLAVYGVIGSATGIAFPMSTREALAAGEAGLRNAMHPIGTAVMSLVLLVAMAFGARLLGGRFRSYTYATILILLLFGILTSLQAGRMTSNLPTPLMGLEERVNIYATMLWVAMLALGLLRQGGAEISDATRRDELVIEKDGRKR